MYAEPLRWLSNMYGEAKNIVLCNILPLITDWYEKNLRNVQYSRLKQNIKQVGSTNIFYVTTIKRYCYYTKTLYTWYEIIGYGLIFDAFQLSC